LFTGWAIQHSTPFSLFPSTDWNILACTQEFCPIAADVLFNSVSTMSEYTDDAYEVLGVSPTATEREIKTAYRKLALVYHPDRQSDDKQREIATTKFVKIANAYEVLTDPYLRAEYNQRRQCYAPVSKPASPASSNDSNNRATPTNASPPSVSKNNTKSTGNNNNSKPSRKNRNPEPDIKQTPFRYHFSDAYEVFKRDFREQFGIEYPGAKYDWIDFNEPIVAPANTANQNTSKMITDGTEETPAKRKGFNLFRRQTKDTMDPSKNDRQLVVRDGNNKDSALSASTCTDIVLVEKRNNRPIAMDVQTSTDGTITTTRTTITRPDGSTETITTRTGIPGKAPSKPNHPNNTTAPLKQLTNGPTKKLVTNGTSSTPSKSVSSTSTAMVKSTPSNSMTTTKSKAPTPAPAPQQQMYKTKLGRVGK
jgi:curved DNA-binding protein CbpA